MEILLQVHEKFTFSKHCENKTLFCQYFAICEIVKTKFFGVWLPSWGSKMTNGENEFAKLVSDGSCPPELL